MRHDCTERLHRTRSATYSLSRGLRNGGLKRSLWQETMSPESMDCTVQELTCAELTALTVDAPYQKDPYNAKHWFEAAADARYRR